MEKKAIELLKNHLTQRERVILSMFEILNKKTILKGYTVDKRVLEVLIDYFKTGDEEKLSKIWSSDSIQRKMFFYCIKIWNKYQIRKTLTKDDIAAGINEELLKGIFIELYPELIKLCQDNGEEHKNNVYFYEDDIFKVATVKLDEYESIKNYFSPDETYFRIIFDGIVIIEDQILFKGEGYFSRDELILENVTPITKECSQVVMAIKNSFLKDLEIDFTNIRNKKITIGNLKLFDIFIKKKEITPDNYFQVFQLFTYLAQIVKQDEVDLFDIPYLEYKREIVKELEKKYLENERYIVDKLAVSLQLSVPTLYKIFNILFKESPIKYIERKKMNYACGRLTNTKESIENISLQLGYSRRTFSKKFFVFSGYMPTKFRELMVK